MCTWKYKSYCYAHSTYKSIKRTKNESAPKKVGKSYRYWHSPPSKSLELQKLNPHQKKLVNCTGIEFYMSTYKYRTHCNGHFIDCRKPIEKSPKFDISRLKFPNISNCSGSVRYILGSAVHYEIVLNRFCHQIWNPHYYFRIALPQWPPVSAQTKCWQQN